MKNMLIAVPCLLVCACSTPTTMVDPGATAETKNLYANLKQLSLKGFLFGHQDDDAYGIGWWDVPGGSDVKGVCGAYPALHGWDISKYEQGSPYNIDSVNFGDMHRWIREVYERGGVNTISWHLDNPVTHTNAWDKTPAVKAILPGGAEHDAFVRKLDSVAKFLGACKDGDTMIPIIFRPWHEHNGDWFWWGKGNCSEEDYIALWRFTITYLRDTKGLHNLLFAISPDRSRMNIAGMPEAYLYGYPGDAYVDILGFDDYMDVDYGKDKAQQHKDLVTALHNLTRLAAQKGKLAALTETGQNGIKDATLFTQDLLAPIESDPDIHIAYLLVWRNFQPSHHFAPYPGHPSAPDFVTFFNSPTTFFEPDVQHLYTTGQAILH